jgi:hypothetical protein
MMFLFGQWPDKNGFSHAFYCTTFPTTFDGNALERGKHELQRYLRNLRPLLVNRGIYLYCTLPSTLLKTDVKTGQYNSEKEKRPLVALPTSVESAEVLGRSQEEIRGLAPPGRTVDSDACALQKGQTDG